MRPAWPALIALGALACGASGPPAAPELRLGEQTCEECAMSLSDARVAAAMTVEDERGRRHELFFDDLGCFFDFAADHPERRPLARYVRDFEGDGWLPAEDATYLQGGGIATPMGYDIVAFGSVARARAERAARGGRVLALEDLVRGAVR